MQFFRTRAFGVLLLSTATGAQALAAPPANSAYSTDLQTSQVEDATSRGIGDVNMIACIMSAMRPDALVNEPNYVALIDKNKCDSAKRSSSSNAGASDGAQAAAAYMTATVSATRASNSAPMITKAWLDLDEDGAHVQVSVHISATAAPSSTNPYGAFRLDYCGQLDGIGDCAMRGYLEAANGGINYFDLNVGDYEQSTRMNLAVTSNGGNGRLEITGDGGDSAFAFAYDQDLFHRDIEGDRQCFSRDARDPDTGLSVWRYGLYNSETGARIARNSGFPIEFANNGTTYRGFLGYYGLSLPPEASEALVNGSIVTKVDYSTGSTPTRLDYHVVKTDGKLIKFTRRSSTLAQLDQIRFNTFVGMEGGFFDGAAPNIQYEVYWNESTLDFVVSGQMQCDQNGCQTSAVAGEPHVAASFWAPRGGVQGWSQSLGGEVFIDLHGVVGAIESTLVPVVYRTQDIVYPGDTGLPATLHCLQNCPTQASLEAYFTSSDPNSPASPYAAASYNNWNPSPLNAVVNYNMHADTAILGGGDGSDAPVTYTNAETYSQRPQYSNGVTSGRLFANLDDAACDAMGGGVGYCDWKVNNAEVYYQWQTGPNSWNQFVAVDDGNGGFVHFEAPLQVSFHVPDQAAYGQYRNTNMVLQYGGFGDLWGIPGTCVSANTNEAVACNTPESRYVPAFVIPYSETLGTVRSTGDDHTSYLVKWLEREIRFARKDPSVCNALSLPITAELPTLAGAKNPTDPNSDAYIGTKPTVTDAPRVIHGEVKY